MSYVNAERLVALLIEKGLRISFAESCTGGLLAAGIVDVPDASRVLDASFVTYANEAKTRLVGVNPEDIAAYGAVSEQVAGQMAAGAAMEAGADVGCATSGIAGPTGGTAEKPIGTVCFGFYLGGRVVTETCRFGNLGRSAVRAAAVDYAYGRLLELIK